MIRLRAVWEYLRGTYWAVPSAMALAALLLAVGVMELDGRLTAALLDRWSWVYTGGPEGARAVLSTIAGSMITVAGVTFSITIVALTLASQQFDRLLDLASKRDVQLTLHIRPGVFLRAGAPMMTIHAPAFPDGWTDGPLRGVVIVGTERTGTQDIEFFISQLVELAVRALSPGINDPATVRSCIDRLEHAPCELASRRFPSPRRYDADRTLRVTVQPLTFAVLVDSAFSKSAATGRRACWSPAACSKRSASLPAASVARSSAGRCSRRRWPSPSEADS